jgi:hypothetical protein
MPPDLIHFIKDVLGCTCPDEVLADIQVVPDPDGFAGLPVDFLLRVGGRLLVGICAPDTPGAVGALLSRCFAAGRALRDAEGFNRFRLVVVSSDPDQDANPLRAAFDGLPMRDGKLHLHVITRPELPEALTARLPE